MTTQVEANAKCDVIYLNVNDQEPGCINKNDGVTDDQEQEEISTNINITDYDTDDYMCINKDSLLKQINVITGNQDDPSALNSRIYGTEDGPTTLTSITGDSKKSSNVTPNKVHRKNLVTIYKLQKNTIHKLIIIEPRGYKSCYK